MAATPIPHPSTSPSSTTVDWSDSIYKYVKDRIQAINPDREFGGIIDALDWPLPESKQEVFYMVINTSNPNRGQGVGTNPWFSSLYGEQIQWAWNIIGQDIHPNVLERNRGDKYRKNMTMRQELLHGCYPGFCEKQKFEMQGIYVIGRSYTPKEFIWYEKPQFATRFDRNSGILFGSAVMRITGFSPEIQG